MPVIHVFAPEAGDVELLLTRLSNDVSHALGLGDGDVIATFIPAGPTIVSGARSNAGAWPVVSFHGGRRSPDVTGDAIRAAEDAVREWGAHSGVTILGVW